MPINVLTIKTIDDQTLHFRAQSEEKDVNGLPEVDNVERLRAVLESEDPEAAFECEDLDGQPRTVPAEQISQYDVEKLDDVD
ncbi:hypothetical protein [Corynebacterium sp.]|uniref:hypothetical protein n=1 Tax=Corynebacterium sp. TaxID=1720 RepID=UPI0026DF3631|nr:hypothetical protein [Corynebacterium sp.]MDO5513325.1 hypothetical protein [Corynebacterium sp.]